MGAGNIATMRQSKNTCNFLIGKPEGKRPFVDLAVDGRIMLKWI
jgi:hypothetical protein